MSLVGLRSVRRNNLVGEPDTDITGTSTNQWTVEDAAGNDVLRIDTTNKEVKVVDTVRVYNVGESKFMTLNTVSGGDFEMTTSSGDIVAKPNGTTVQTISSTSVDITKTTNITNNSGAQVKLLYDVDNYTNFTSDTSGDLFIAPSGTKTTFVSDVYIPSTGKYYFVPGDTSYSIAYENNGGGGPFDMKLDAFNGFEFYSGSSTTTLGRMGETSFINYRPIEILTTSSQLKLSYDASNYTDITTASNGNLGINPTGNSIGLHGAGIDKSAVTIDPGADGSSNSALRISGTYTNGGSDDEWSKGFYITPTFDSSPSAFDIDALGGWITPVIGANGVYRDYFALKCSGISGSGSVTNTYGIYAERSSLGSTSNLAAKFDEGVNIGDALTNQTNAALQVDSDSQTQLRLSYNSSEYATLSTDSDGDFKILSATGNIGLNTDATDAYSVTIGDDNGTSSAGGVRILGSYGEASTTESSYGMRINSTFISTPSGSGLTAFGISIDPVVSGTYDLYDGLFINNPIDSSSTVTNAVGLRVVRPTIASSINITANFDNYVNIGDVLSELSPLTVQTTVTPQFRIGYNARV